MEESQSPKKLNYDNCPVERPNATSWSRKRCRSSLLFRPSRRRGAESVYIKRGNGSFFMIRVNRSLRDFA
jgi:hypothetical protein